MRRCSASNPHPAGVPSSVTTHAPGPRLGADGVTLPKSASSSLTVLSIVNLDLNGLGLPLECLGLGGYRARLLFLMLLPPIFAADQRGYNRVPLGVAGGLISGAAWAP